MARPLRVNLRDGWYHCMHRGIERHAIYRDDRDFCHFLELLGQTTERFRFVVHAYCLLGNHYHAIIQTPDANLSQGMQWLGLSYSSWFNARHDRAGPLFQGRFKSIPIEDAAWAYELSCYVHLNPIRTRQFSLDRHHRKAESAGYSPPPSVQQVTARLRELREYRWSSYRRYGGYVKGPTWLRSEELLKRSKGTSKDWQRHYRAQVKAILSRGVEESRIESFRDSVGIGSEQFKDMLRHLAGEGLRETERRGRLRERVSFDRVIDAVSEVRGSPSDGLFSQYGDTGKWMVMALARRFCGMTLSELGSAIGGRDYGAVGVGLKRFEKRMVTDKLLQKEYMTLTEMLNV
jgi:putative transposase